MSAAIKVSQNLNALAHGINETIKRLTGENIGFALVVFTPERAQYISNCDRSDVVDGISELLKRWEQGMPDVPAHKLN